MADPLVAGRKSRTLSVFTPRLGINGMRAGLIRRSCMSHFTHTTEEKRHQVLMPSVCPGCVQVNCIFSNYVARNAHFKHCVLHVYMCTIHTVYGSMLTLVSLLSVKITYSHGANKPEEIYRSYVCVHNLYLEWDCPGSWATGGGGALCLLPALEATPSTPPPWRPRCFPPAAGPPPFPTSDHLRTDTRQHLD